jgi:hypothetical protein
MSLTSKSTLSLKKKDVQQQKKAGTAYRRLVFAHKASAGEVGITFTALTQPSEMAALGFTNPSSSDILAANILFYKKNLTVISSARGVLMQDLSYTVPTSSRIEFQGFTALQDEIFTCLLETGVKDGLNVVDASPIIATGELAIGDTDFNVGIPFEVNKYSTQQVGAVLVFRDGVVQFRNPNNGTTGGNYQEVDNGGLATLIRFNEAPVSEASQIVVWGNLMSERPDGSMMAAIESIAGQLDQMIPTLAALAGVPTTTFQAQPNNQDLKAFGDRVHSILDIEIPKKTSWQNAGPINIIGTGLSKGATVVDRVLWKQDGEDAIIRYEYKQSGAGVAGSSPQYEFELPASLVMDGTKVALATEFDNGAVKGAHVGSGDGWVTTDGNHGIFDVYVGSAANRVVIIFNDGAGDGYVGNAGFSLANATVGWYFVIRVPIAGFQASQTIREIIGA